GYSGPIDIVKKKFQPVWINADDLGFVGSLGMGAYPMPLSAPYNLEPPTPYLCRLLGPVVGFGAPPAKPIIPISFLSARVHRFGAMQEKR
ncbi:MAG: hypothetical protein AB2637_03980, partial [Candidatus Thiodiazotropha sp.]